MKKIIIVSILFFSSLIFSGCQTKQATVQNLNVEKTGTLQAKIGDEYLLNTPDGMVNINSTKLNLENYLKKKIKVSGQFSGSTLYIDNVSEIK